MKSMVKKTLRSGIDSNQPEVKTLVVRNGKKSPNQGTDLGKF